jgi:restriction system protein
MQIEWALVKARRKAECFIFMLSCKAQNAGRKLIKIDARNTTQRCSEKKIVLINGEHLAQFMIDHSIGVSEVVNYIVKRVDLDYFDYGQ